MKILLDLETLAGTAVERAVVVRWLSQYVPPEDREQLLTWSTEAFESGKPLTSHVALMRYFIDMMYARMETPAEDVMGLFVDNEVQGDLLPGPALQVAEHQNGPVDVR